MSDGYSLPKNSKEKTIRKHIVLFTTSPVAFACSDQILLISCKEGFSAHPCYEMGRQLYDLSADGNTYDGFPPPCLEQIHPFRALLVLREKLSAALGMASTTTVYSRVPSSVGISLPISMRVSIYPRWPLWPSRLPPPPFFQKCDNQEGRGPIWL